MLGLLFAASCLSTTVLAWSPPDRGHLDTAKIAQNGIAVTNQSWEYGALTQALIELDAPTLAVFHPHSIPPPTHNSKNTIPAAVWTTVTSITAKETANDTVLIDGAGAAGDPASVGPAIMLANTVEHNSTWTWDIQKELNHLLTQVPRSADGGISQRENEVQFWSDFMYMVPPFLAYYGALTNNISVLSEAHHQSEVYRAALYDGDAQLWEHIVFGDFQLNQHWATGNGWAAMGMMRVLATIQASSFAKQLASEQQDLANWVDEILTGAFKHQQTNGTIFNYIDYPANETFSDSAGTALIAAAAYRHAVYTGSKTHIVAAENAFALVAKSVDSQGWLTGAVDPLVFGAPLAAGNHSPEGQSFVLMLQAARQAYWASV